MAATRFHVEVGGIVQGVGFRPFIHKQIRKYGLYGWVRNTSNGAEMELEGEKSAVNAFISELKTEKPSLAQIEYVSAEELPDPAGYTDFQILSSHRETETNTLISPDVCVCEDCLRELFTETDRRYRYPFVNCTNCGPRFTIIRDVPYDREKTTMASFPMCPDCRSEYSDIEDRRYHAQPDCCPDCGPKLFFADGEGKALSGDAISLAQDYLREGKIIAVKGLGGFHLACRTEDAEAARRLRKNKHRDEKPFALMCADLAEAEKLCFVSEAEKQLLTGPQRPIVLLQKRDASALSHISENDRLGVMLPYTPMHYLLLHDDIRSLVMTSANLSDRPIVYKNEEALSELRGIAEGFLLHDREIHVRCDDSLAWVFREKPYFARRSRGYVPLPLSLPDVQRSILACGAEQKATFSLSKDGHVFPSQHIGDLKNLESYDNYQQQISHFEKLFDIKPELIVCDFHPDYLSTAYAEERAEREKLPLLHVQHHFAHMASCMADNDLDTPCIGVIWDGTGCGTDGETWGGEFLTGDFSGFTRFGSIRPITLPGGDKAVKEIWRIGCAMLAEIGETGDFTSEQTVQIGRMLSLGVNCPKSSGMGRLFDGAAAILGIRETVSYEGQGATLLEAIAGETAESWPLTFYADGGVLRFDHREMTREILREKRAGICTEILAAKFMNTLVEMAAEMCRRIREETDLDIIVLSGGSFQNIYMLTRLMEKLEAMGFHPYCHRRVSPNDEGISLGQIAIARKMPEAGNIGIG